MFYLRFDPFSNSSSSNSFIVNQSIFTLVFRTPSDAAERGGRDSRPLDKPATQRVIKHTRCLLLLFAGYCSARGSESDPTRNVSRYTGTVRRHAVDLLTLLVFAKDPPALPIRIPPYVLDNCPRHERPSSRLPGKANFECGFGREGSGQEQTTASIKLAAELLSFECIACTQVLDMYVLHGR